MASRIRAISAYRPRFKRGITLKMEDVIELIMRHTSLGAGEILSIAREFGDVLVYAHRLGHAIKIDGLGTFTPTLRANGRVETVFQSEPLIKRLLNHTAAMSAEIRNKSNLGKSAEELIALWNADHPDDPVR